MVVTNLRVSNNKVRYKSLGDVQPERHLSRILQNKLALLLPTDRATHYVTQNLANCSNKLYNNTHTRPFNSPFSRTTRVSRYQRSKTNLDFTEARDSEWQWHQLGHTQVCTSLQTDNHTSTPPLSFLQAGCPSCHPTNSIKALKAHCTTKHTYGTRGYS